MLYELARNEDYQTRLRTEIESVMSHYDNVNTEALTEMVYLDMVFRGKCKLIRYTFKLSKNCFSMLYQKIIDNDLQYEIIFTVY